MKRWGLKIMSFIVSLFALLTFLSAEVYAEELIVFCGAAFKKPLDEVIERYDKSKVRANYGAFHTLLSQLSLGKQGDVFFVPSPDIMELAVKKGLVKKESVKNFLYLVPVIVVKKGNPKKIHGLKDLLRPDVRFAMANPETVYIGSLAAEIFEKNLSPDELNILRKKIQTYAEDISKLFSYLLMDQVDAILGFNFLKGWAPDKVDVVKLKPHEVIRIGHGAIGIITFSKNPKEAERFINFMLSDKAQEVFKKYGYITSLKEAYAFLGEVKPVGGAPTFSKDWFIIK